MAINRSKTCLLSLVSFCLFLSACSYKKDILPPANLIAQDTMELLITELTITEAALNTGIPTDTLKKLNTLADYKISLQRFDSSFSYYSKNPEKLKEIYGKVLEGLNKK